jgi:hypothetical protein
MNRPAAPATNAIERMVFPIIEPHCYLLVTKGLQVTHLHGKTTQREPRNKSATEFTNQMRAAGEFCSFRAAAPVMVHNLPRFRQAAPRGRVRPPPPAVAAALA